MTIGERIKYLREKNNLSQEELGNRIGTTKQTIFKYEKNITTNIPMDKIEEMAKVFGVSPGYVMGWVDSSENLNSPTPKNPATIRSLGRLQANDFTEDEAEQIDDYISFILEKRKKNKKL